MTSSQTPLRLALDGGSHVRSRPFPTTGDSATLGIEEIDPVNGSTSAKIGTAFCASTPTIVPKSVMGGAMTSSPGYLPTGIDRHSFWLLPLIIDPVVVGADNARYGAALRAEGIPVSSGYLDRPAYLVPALTERKVYGKAGFPFTAPPARTEIRYSVGDCPVAETLINQTLMVLPWNERYTDEDVDDIATAMRKVHGHFVAR